MSVSNYRILVFLLISLLFNTLSFAQQLPELPEDKTIVSGTLPNRTKYYIVANPVSKNMADFALVQKSGKMSCKDKSELENCDVLKQQNPRNGIIPLRFFADNDILPSDRGFIEDRDDAVIFRFNEVMPVSDEALLDSALLVLMTVQQEWELADTSDCAEKDYAIVISGDINPNTLSQKLKMLSYIVPSIPAAEKKKYEWKPEESSFMSYKSDDRIASISISWKLPRTPEDKGETILPIIHDCLIAELGVVAVERMKTSLQEASIPCADISWKHISSFMTTEDEKMQITLKVADGYAVPAVQVAAKSLSSILNSGILSIEYSHARKSYIRSLGRVSKYITNQDNINRCISAFLNGTSPISPRERLKYHQSKSVQDSVGTVLLRRVARASMTIDKNCTVEFTSSSEVTSDSLKNIFIQSWNSSEPATLPFISAVSDTLTCVEQQAKTRVKSIRKEPVSGGSVWTFANDMKVVYRRMQTEGRIYWSLGLEGGYGSIPELAPGEGAFIGDMLKLSKVSGMKWDDFIVFLESKGVELRASVGLTKTILSGTATNESLPLLFRALAAIANEREVDEEAFNMYLRNEWHRLELVRRGTGNAAVIVDSLMCPGYKYSKVKKKGVLNAGLQKKAETFFESRFSMMNDGVLVLIGDKEESLVRKEIRKYMSYFRTREGFYPRPTISFHPTGGAMTHTEEGESDRIYIAMSVQMPLNRENVIVSEAAAEIMRRELISAISGTGASARLLYDLKITPHERFNVLVILDDASEGTLKAAREVFSEKAINAISNSEVDNYKPWLKNKKALQMEDPVYWTTAVMLRYLEGKDFTTGYAAEIDNITGEKVRSLLTSLINSSKVEYIIKKK